MATAFLVGHLGCILLGVGVGVGALSRLHAVSADARKKVRKNLAKKRRAHLGLLSEAAEADGHQGCQIDHRCVLTKISMVI